MDENESIWWQGVHRKEVNLTSSVSNTAWNSESPRTDKFTAPSNSRSIRATSSATHRRSFPVPWINCWVDEKTVGMRTKLSWIVDTCGEAVGFRVERAEGIQSRPPLIQPIPKSTSWRFGNSEKLKDRPKPSWSPTWVAPEITITPKPTGREGVGLTVHEGRV